MNLGWAIRLAARRLAANWRTLLTIIAGVVLAAGVGALIPLYSAAVAQVSMVEALANHPLNEVNITASVALVPRKSGYSERLPAYDQTFRGILQDAFTPFPGWLSLITAYAETSALDVIPPTEDASASRAFLAYYEGWTERVSLISGRYPTEAPNDPAADVEIVIPFEAHNNLNLPLESIIVLDQGGARGGWDSSRNIRARIVGVAEPPPIGRDPYFMSPAPTRYTSLKGDYAAEYPVLTTRPDLERVATQFIPDTPTRAGWRVGFDPTALSFTALPDARRALLGVFNGVKGALSADGEFDLAFLYATKLIDYQVTGGESRDVGHLLAFEMAIRSLDAPFGLLLLQIGALVLFFLIVTAALVRRGERREIAMLQSRGAADRGVIVVRGFEAFLICTVGAVAAPFLAQGLLVAITPFFARYPNLPLALTPTVFLYSAAAAAAAFLALISTLRPVLRLPLIAAGGAASRSGRQAWWQRYYVDVIVAVLGMAALLRLVGRETPLFRTATGGSASDPFLLLAPGLLFLGLGSILLRVFPIIAAGAARFLAAGRGLIRSLATWQLARESLHYGRITFLLALAVGIGWFATSFRATVDRSQSDQARYRVGTDVRFNERDVTLNAARARDLERYEALPGVATAAISWRRANLNVQPNAGDAALFATLFGVDPAHFGEVIHWRPDLGTVALPEPVELPERGVLLPFAPAQLSLWARFDMPSFEGRFSADVDRLLNRITLNLRFLDAAGVWVNIPLTLVETEYVSTGAVQPGAGGGGDFTTSGWVRYVADVAALAHQPTAPLRLISIHWTHRGRSAQGERFLRLTLAALRGREANGAWQPLDLFRDERWAFAYDSGAFSEGTVVNTREDRGDSLVVQWDQTAATARMGVLLNYLPLRELPMIASHSLAERLRLQPGQRFTTRNVEGVAITFRFIGVQAYYPALFDATLQEDVWREDAERQAFLITDRDTLLYTLNRRPSAALYADEVWIKTLPGVEAESILDAARPADRTAALLNPVTLSGALVTLQTDPLSRGLLGLMLLAFLLAMALSIVGLTTYTALTAVNRKSEFGILRALGLPSMGVIGQLAFEVAFVVGMGVILGAALGILLSDQVVPRLALDASGSQITPPFIVAVETVALAQYGGVLAAVILGVVVFSLFLVRRLSLTQTLRLGED